MFNMKVLTVLKENILYKTYVYSANITEENLEIEVARKLVKHGIKRDSESLLTLMEDGYLSINGYDFYLSETVKEA